MIQIQSLSHHYPRAAAPALDNVSFDIADGECLGLLGHNGAGKTTLMSLLAGLQPVRHGAVLFDGKPLLYKMRDKNKLRGLIEQAGLQEHAHKAAKHLSGGLKRRLNFAVGLVNAPQLVFLDEITVGIDPQSRRFILDSVADLTRQEVTVVYTSHYLPEIEQLCSKIALLQHGHLVYQGSLNELLNAQAQTVRFITEPMLQPETLAMLQAAPLDNRGMMQTQQDAAAVYAALQQSGTQIRYFQQGHGSLEAFYLDFLRRETEQP